MSPHTLLHWDSIKWSRDRELAYEDAYLNPWPATERGLVDDVIDPADSRIVLCSVLRQLCTKRELVVGRIA